MNGLRNLAELYDNDASESMVDPMEFQHILNEIDQEFDAATKLKAVSVKHSSSLFLSL